MRSAAGIPVLQGGEDVKVFDFPVHDWETFVVNKMLGDLAEILQVEDLLHCSFVPLRNLARSTMPEEKFHHQFGMDFARAIAGQPGGRARLQTAVNAFFPVILGFFRRAGSKNNELFRRWGIKLRTNEAMRADYIQRARSACEEVGLTLPPTPAEYGLPA